MCLPKQTEILFSCDMVCCEQIISVHRHGRTHRHMHTSLSSECRDNHARSEFSYPPTPESFCSREQKTRAPHLLSSHLCLLPRNCHESSVYMNVCVCVCAHVCLSVRGCLQAKLCRVFHCNFLMTLCDTVPKGNPACVTKSCAVQYVCKLPCSCFFALFFAGMYLSGDLCVCKGVCVHWWVCVWHHCWVCAQCALWQIADLSGNVGAGFYFKSMSEQLELASTTNTQTVAQAHTSD